MPRVASVYVTSERAGEAGGAESAGRCGRAGGAGFSLFELLIVLVIVGTVAGVGINAFFFAPASLADAAQSIVREVEAARSQALLTHKPVVLHLHETFLIVDKEARKRQLPERVHILTVNDLPASEQPLVFHPQGVVQESLIVLESRPQDGTARQATVYVPSVGSAVIFEGYATVDSLRANSL